MNTEVGVPENAHTQGQKHIQQAQQQPLKHTDSAKHVTKLSTSSPEAIRVAAEITPTRLANLLIKKGPLAIRLITAQLAIEVPGFDLLSLSKQRRLIMAAMEAGDSENNVVFEKIGWGQWAVRKKDSDYIVTEGSASDEKARISVYELKEKAKLGWSKKEAKKESSSLNSRRESISNGKHNLHNVSVPDEKLNVASGAAVDSDEEDDDDNMVSSSEDELHKLRSGRFGTLDDDDNAIAEDSDEDNMDIADDGLFQFDQDNSAAGRNDRPLKKSPPVSFAKRVPLKVSPPPHHPGGRRKSSSSAGVSSVQKNTYTNRHQLFNRSRLNSIENLDNYIVSSARGSSLSVSSPPPPSSSVLSVSPIGSWSASNNHLLPGTFNITPESFGNTLGGRRKSSFNESSIRSTLSSSLPKGSVPTHGSKLSKQDASDTDEEDWATIGAESLRKHSAGSSSSPAKEDKLRSEEKQAARALVDLMSI